MVPSVFNFMVVMYWYAGSYLNLFSLVLFAIEGIRFLFFCLRVQFIDFIYVCVFNVMALRKHYYFVVLCCVCSMMVCLS